MQQRRAPYPGNGEMARRVREHHWAGTPLGPFETWPDRLKGAVDALLKSGFPAVALWGPDLIQIYNDGYRVIMGNKHPSGLGQPTAECWPEVWHINQPIYERVRAGETVTFEDALFPITRHGGLEDAWFTLSYSPMQDDDGDVVGVLVTVFETTARHKAELALKQSEERFRAFVTATADVVYRMSPDWSEMRQLDGQGFLSDTVEPTESWMERYIHPQDRAFVQRAIDQAIAAKALFELEHRVLRTDGTLGWTSSRAVPITDAQGRVVEWLGAASDVTARKGTEEALKEAEHRQRAMVESIPQMIWRASPNGDRTWSSPQWTAWTGISEAESLGSAWLDAVHPQDREATLEAWRDAEATGAFRVDHRLREEASGRYHWFESQAAADRDTQGRIAGWHGASTDVEALRRLQEQRMLVAELQHRSRNLLTVVGAVAEQTLETAGTLEEFGASFEERLAALGRVQGLISREVAPTVTVRELVMLELAAHGVDAGEGSGVSLIGPEIVLPLEALQLLALALHELTTNALKHGALAQKGRLAIDWESRSVPDGGERRLRLRWTESGLKQMQAEPPVGFGRQLIEAVLPFELDATTQFEFRGDGIHCTLELALADEAADFSRPA